VEVPLPSRETAIFQTHFQYLISSSQAKRELAAIGKQVKSIKSRGKDLSVDFENGLRLIAYPPATKAETRSWPRAFQPFIIRHRALSFGKATKNGKTSNDLWLGIGVGPELNDSRESKLLSHFDSTGEILCPLATVSDWWLFHPKKKITKGRPAIVFLSHEGEASTRISKLWVTDFFIHLISETLTQGSKHQAHLSQLRSLPPLTSSQKKEAANLDHLNSNYSEKVYEVLQDKRTKRESGRVVAYARGLVERYFTLYRQSKSEYDRARLDPAFDQLREWIQMIEKNWSDS
jgi:hypothetical protein